MGRMSSGWVLGGSLAVLLGGWLDVSFGLHVKLGNSAWPKEAMEGFDELALAVLSGTVVMGFTGAGLLWGRAEAMGKAVCVAASLCALAAAVRTADGESYPLVSMPGLLRAGVVMIHLGTARSLVEKNQGKNGASSSMNGLYLAVAFLAFVLATSRPEDSCFAQLGPSSDPLEVASSARATFEIGRNNEFNLEVRENGLVLTAGNGKVVLATPAGKAFVAAALEGGFDAPNDHEMGIYAFDDRASTFSSKQSVAKAWAEAGGVKLAGELTFGTVGRRVAYEAWFGPDPAAQWGESVRFSVKTAEPVARLYLRQSSAADEAIFGMGVQYSFSDLKGGCVPVFTAEQGIGRGIQPISWLVNFFVKHASASWQTSYAPAPYFLTSTSRAMYLDSSAFSLFDFSRETEITIEINATSVSGALLQRDTPQMLLETYTRLHAGRMRPLPDWVGNGAIVGLQGGTAKVRAHVETLRAAGVPLAALWLQDWTGKRETDFGRRLQWNWEVSDRHYPGWRELIEELARDKVYVLSYINAYLADTGGRSNESTTLFRAANAVDCLVKESDNRTVQIQASATPDFTYGTVDLSNPRCQQWYIDEVITKNMFDRETKSFDTVHGVLGFMADFAESVSMGASFYAGQGHALHNDFPVMWAETCRKAIDANPFLKENAVFFTRAAGAKSPGQTTLMWMGDQMTTWDHYDGLQSALRGVLSAGLSGFTLSHSDVGGYTMFYRFGGLLQITRSPELLMRWAELNVFSDAVFRTHEGVLPDQSSQVVDASVKDHFAKMATLHAKLFHALKKPLMTEAFEKGMPLARHMLLQYPKDPVARKARDQFLLGMDILVCPVVRPGKTSVDCYVPDGVWYHVFTDERPEPRKYFRCKAPIGEPCVLYTPRAAHIAQIIKETLRVPQMS